MNIFYFYCNFWAGDPRTSSIPFLTTSCHTHSCHHCHLLLLRSPNTAPGRLNAPRILPCQFTYCLVSSKNYLHWLFLYFAHFMPQRFSDPCGLLCHSGALSSRSSLVIFFFFKLILAYYLSLALSHDLHGSAWKGIVRPNPGITGCSTERGSEDLGGHWSPCWSEAMFS